MIVVGGPWDVFSGVFFFLIIDLDVIYGCRVALRSWTIVERLLTPSSKYLVVEHIIQLPFQYFEKSLQGAFSLELLFVFTCKLYLIWSIYWCFMVLVIWKKLPFPLLKLDAYHFFFISSKPVNSSQSLSLQLHNNPSQKKNIIDHLILHHPQLGAAVFGYNLSR